MSKRGADKQLTHDNWDAEDSGDEEPGQFQPASEDVLRGRVIKKARRRVNRTDSPGAAASPFAAFSGFGAGVAKPAGGATNPFGFLAATTKTSATKPSSPVTKPSTPASKPSSLAAKSVSPAAEPQTPAAMSSPVLPRPPLRSGSGSGSAEYHRQLQALNRSLLSWLQAHVDRNPLCILSPVFRDYETHLASIERRFGPAAVPSPAAEGAGSAAPADKTAAVSAAARPADSAPPPVKSVDATPPPAKSGFSFGVGGGQAAGSGAAAPPATSGFSFGLPQGKAGLAGSAATPASAGFSFGLSADKPASATSAAPASTAGFSFGFQSGSQGGGAAPATTTTTTTEQEEESEEPPVPVVSTVKEDDAVYSKKCKLFYKKDGSFVEKGVGMLYLKPCSDEKFQCLIRADTNLGNILLNIKLSKSIPCQRMGKNNVMMACVPNPPLDPKKEADTTPVPLLIRVKTADDADELLRQIDEHKR